MLAATMVPVILLPPSVTFEEIPLFIIVLLEVAKDVFGPFADTPPAAFAEASGVADADSVGVAVVVSEGVGVMAIAVDESSFFPHPPRNSVRELKATNAAINKCFLFFMIWLLNLLFFKDVFIIIVRNRICRK